MGFRDLIGLSVVALRGYPYKTILGDRVDLDFVLFSDGQSYLKFGKQDTYDYHDCNHSARTVEVCRNKDEWERLMSSGIFAEPTKDMFS